MPYAFHSMFYALRPSLYALCAFFLFGCQATVSKFKAPLQEEGEVFLYLQSYPQEAERLKFTIEGIFAVKSDGAEIPLDVSLRELKAQDLRRQRLLGSGRLPPGSYSGLSFKVKSASLKVEDGEASLLVPEVPATSEFSFRVERKRSLVVSLTFKYRESISGGFSLSPVFSMAVPTKPIPSLVGYVSNTGSNNITVFEKKLGQVVDIIATGKGPAGIVLDQKQKKAFVALSGDDAIEVIDMMAGEIINRLWLRMGDHPLELSLTPDGRTLLVVNYGSNTLSFIDAQALFEKDRIRVGNGPISVLIDSTGRRAFVFNTNSNTITVIDMPNRAIVTTLSTDPVPLRGQFNRRGDKLYVIHEFSNYLTVTDPVSLSVPKRYLVRVGMVSIKVDTRTDLVYLGRRGDVVAEVYDPFSFVPVDSVRTGGSISYMTIDGEENNLYLVSADRKSVIASNLVGKRPVFEIDVGDDPYWVTVMGER